MKKKHSTIMWRFGAVLFCVLLFCWVFVCCPSRFDSTNWQVFGLGVTCLRSATSQGGTGDSSAFLLHHKAEL